MSTAAHRSWGAEIKGGKTPAKRTRCRRPSYCAAAVDPMGMRRGRVKGELTQKVHWPPGDGSEMSLQMVRASSPSARRAAIASVKQGVVQDPMAAISRCRQLGRCCGTAEPRSGSGTAFVDVMQAVQHRGAPSDWSAEAPVRACRDGACGGAARVNDHRRQSRAKEATVAVAIWEHGLHITVYPWETVHPARRRGRWNRHRTRDPSWLRA